MSYTVPATHLVAVGECSAACLLAVDPGGSCECTCDGRHHAALSGAMVQVDTGPRPERERRPLLADLLGVLGEAERMHSADLLDGLCRRWPDAYQGWTVEQLAHSLRGYNVRTRQIMQRTPDGRGVNRRGVVRGELVRALDGAV